ncbi:DUF3592 domain-containing protein [Tropicimonas sediminicola]|uniref:DUF3592 domain-containing protein n=1 Tax=Tropicimonas sediminicola TaxID=1031541 RepID=A0A239F144_9RHOB|nr:DUF3592 domain-containing protein [Tropicimonas sediminicola]SNS49814.1 Protein of unknown function [Tropicimonas sediminicola]
MEGSLDDILKLLLCVGGLGFVFAGLFMLRDAIRIAACHDVSPGTIVDTRFHRARGSDSDRSAIVTVRFKAANGALIQYEQAAPGGVFALHTEQGIRSLQGRTIDVHHDWRNPQRATISLTRDFLMGGTFAALGAFVCLLLFVNWDTIAF